MIAHETSGMLHVEMSSTDYSIEDWSNGSKVDFNGDYTWNSATNRYEKTWVPEGGGYYTWTMYVTNSGGWGLGCLMKEPDWDDGSGNVYEGYSNDYGILWRSSDGELFSEYTASQYADYNAASATATVTPVYWYEEKNWWEDVTPAKANVIQGYEKMPAAASGLVGRFIHYAGESTSKYKKGHVYRCDRSDFDIPVGLTVTKISSDPEFPSYISAEGSYAKISEGVYELQDNSGQAVRIMQDSNYIGADAWGIFTISEWGIDGCGWYNSALEGDYQSYSSAWGGMDVMRVAATSYQHVVKFSWTDVTVDIPTALSGNGNPGSSTKADFIGQVYAKSNGQSWICTGANGSSYTWTENISAKGGTIDGATLTVRGGSNYTRIGYGIIDLTNSNNITNSSTGQVIYMGTGCVTNVAKQIFIGNNLAGNNMTTCIVIGKYNQSKSNSGMRLCVGNGANNNSRTNTLEIFDNGNIQTDGSYNSMIKEIPAATSTYTIPKEGMYKHAPTAVPTYVLPNVTNETVSHSIFITVTFSADVLACGFRDTSNNVITPRALSGTIAAGTKVQFLCEWCGQWVIYPLICVD